MYGGLLWCSAFILALLSYSSCSITFDSKVIEPLVKECNPVVLSSNVSLPENFIIELRVDVGRIVDVNPKNILVKNNSNWSIQVCGETPGFTIVTASLNGSSRPEDESFLHVIVGKSSILKFVALAVGWIYFTAWSVSFYPQMYDNYSRLSVVGLNFDFVTLNIVGYLLYSFYNVGLYYLPSIQKEYFSRYPAGLNPVEFNDVFFSVHAFFASVVIIYQCFRYESGDQKVSWLAKMILFAYFCIVMASGVAAYVQVIHWIDFLYYCSYIKLSVTIIKYIPQAVTNYTRKSTVGWCIGNVILDFTGGTFSVAQMLINGHNYDDWASIFGDPTKFGLGIFSIAFDTLFLYQHFVLYRNTEYEEPIIDDSVHASDVSTPPVHEIKKHGGVIDVIED